MKKHNFFFYFYILFYGFICFYQLVRPLIVGPAFNYFNLNCSIYSTSGELFFRSKNSVICAFLDDGSVIESNPLVGELTRYDKNDTVVWSSNDNAHHMINLTNDKKNMLLLTSEVVSFKGEQVRSDCFSVRSLDNKIINKWCVADHIRDLELLGYKLNGLWTVNSAARYKNENVKKELSHANSFYQIPKNSLQSENPAFSEGHFIVHLYGPIKALLILDSQLQKILWHMKLDVFNFEGINYVIHAHDSQILPNGYILSYFSMVEEIEVPLAKSIDLNLGSSCCENKNNNSHSRLVIINPLTQKLVWEYKRKPLTSFFSPILANVAQLNNGDYFFNDGSVAWVLDSSGRLIWNFKNPSHDINNNPVKIVTLKTFANTAFLKARDLD